MYLSYVVKIKSEIKSLNIVSSRSMMTTKELKSTVDNRKLLFLENTEFFFKCILLRNVDKYGENISIFYIFLTFTVFLMQNRGGN